MCLNNFVYFCMLMDTGAQVSVISEDVWKKINKGKYILDKKTEGKNLLGIGNHKEQIIGIVELKITMMDVEFDEALPSAVVRTESMPYCCILGSNFISANKMVVDFNDQVLSYKK